MFKVTRWVVVPYELRKGSATAGEAQQFYTRGDAEAARVVMTKRCYRVDVFEITGWPVQDLWEEPRQVG